MHILTGAAGFIGSCMLSKLNQKGINDVVIVDDFSREDKNLNLENKSYIEKVDREDLFKWLEINHKNVEFIIHLGARTDTTEFDIEVFNKLNLNYSKAVWNTAVKHSIPMIYASSAATYGMGEKGYDDNNDIIPGLKPLNPYGESKNDFDKWVISQTAQPPYWSGLKFFNVFGPNEYHKGRMASVVFHAYNQIIEKGSVKLFRSHKDEYEDGKQLRDFIYVQDVVDVIHFLTQHKKDSGIYNLGSGKARTFLDLVNGTFAALDKEPEIEFIDTPLDIRDKYQYFTEANMEKLKSIGYDQAFTSLEDGIRKYVRDYLVGRKYF